MGTREKGDKRKMSGKIATRIAMLKARKNRIVGRIVKEAFPYPPPKGKGKESDKPKK